MGCKQSPFRRGVVIAWGKFANGERPEGAVSDPHDPHHRELYYPEMTGAFCVLLPTRENEAWHTWWRPGPDFAISA